MINREVFNVREIKRRIVLSWIMRWLRSGEDESILDDVKKELTGLNAMEVRLSSSSCPNEEIELE